MKQYAIIGLGKFNRQILEQLTKLGVDLIIIDRDRDSLDLYKDQVGAALAFDVVNEAALKKAVPSGVDGALVDLGDKLEASILVTNYLKKMEIRPIIVKAQTNEHEEILRIVGADRVISPDREAAKRITPLLLSSHLLSFLPIAPGLVIAEIQVPESLVGKSLVEVEFRKKYNVNVIAIRHEKTGDYEFFKPDYHLNSADLMLVAGTEEAVSKLTDVVEGSFKRQLKDFFQGLFS